MRLELEVLDLLDRVSNLETLAVNSGTATVGGKLVSGEWEVPLIYDFTLLPPAVDGTLPSSTSVAVSRITAGKVIYFGIECVENTTPESGATDIVWAKDAAGSYTFEYGASVWVWLEVDQGELKWKFRVTTVSWTASARYNVAGVTVVPLFAIPWDSGNACPDKGRVHVYHEGTVLVGGDLEPDNLSLNFITATGATKNMMQIYDWSTAVNTYDPASTDAILIRKDSDLSRAALYSTVSRLAATIGGGIHSWESIPNAAGRDNFLVSLGEGIGPSGSVIGTVCLDYYYRQIEHFADGARSQDVGAAAASQLQLDVYYSAGDLKHKDLGFTAGVSPADTTGGNTDHDERYIQQGDAHNNSFFGTSIGYNATKPGHQGGSQLRVDLDNCLLVYGSVEHTTLNWAHTRLYKMDGATLVADWDDQQLLDGADWTVLSWDLDDWILAFSLTNRWKKETFRVDVIGKVEFLAATTLNMTAWEASTWSLPALDIVPTNPNEIINILNLGTTRTPWETIATRSDKLDCVHPQYIVLETTNDLYLRGTRISYGPSNVLGLDLSGWATCGGLTGTGISEITAAQLQPGDRILVRR